MLAIVTRIWTNFTTKPATQMKSNIYSSYMIGCIWRPILVGAVACLNRWITVIRIIHLLAMTWIKQIALKKKKTKEDLFQCLVPFPKWLPAWKDRKVWFLLIIWYVNNDMWYVIWYVKDFLLPVIWAIDSRGIKSTRPLLPELRRYSTFPPFRNQN